MQESNHSAIESARFGSGSALHALLRRRALANHARALHIDNVLPQFKCRSVWALAYMLAYAPMVFTWFAHTSHLLRESGLTRSSVCFVSGYSSRNSFSLLSYKIVLDLNVPSFILRTWNFWSSDCRHIVFVKCDWSGVCGTPLFIKFCSQTISCFLLC